MNGLLSKRQDEVNAFIVWDTEAKIFIKAFESCVSLSHVNIPDDCVVEDLYGWVVEGFAFWRIRREIDEGHIEVMEECPIFFKTVLKKTPMLQAFKEIAAMALAEDDVLNLTEEEVLKRFVLIEKN